MPVSGRLYGLLAEFDNPTALVYAVRRAREDGYRRLDAFTPYPIEELTEALEFRRTRIPLVIFIGGVTGCVGGYLLQYFCAAWDYPINVGGRPLNSWPAFIPVMFELTVLIAALAAVFGLLGLCGLPRPHHPLFNVDRFALASRDRFFLCIEARDEHFDQAATKEFLAGLHPREVTEVVD
jgi:hypothetical protein